MNDSAVAAIKYALEKCDGPSDSMWFLRLWSEGDFEAIREGYEDVPDEVFIDADPLFKSPAHIQDGEEVEVVAWANPDDLVQDGFSHSFGVSSEQYEGRVPLMTVAQHQRIMARHDDANYNLGDLFKRLATLAGLEVDNANWFEVVGELEKRVAALSAPPAAAGVPDDEWIDPVALSSCSPAYDAGWRDGVSEARRLNSRSAPTPPASEQQRAVVMPEGAREAMAKAASAWLYENDPQGLDWCDARNVDALLDALFEAAPHLAKGEGV
jgi:hypothetical protein